MKMLNKLLLLSIGLIGVSPSMADGPGWTANSTVLKVVVTFSGGINIFLSPVLSGCTSQSGYGPHYASLYPDHPGIDRIYSALLAAYLSNQVVAVYLTDGGCKIGEIELGGR